jgi:hypothetical protein
MRDKARGTGHFAELRRCTLKFLCERGFELHYEGIDFRRVRWAPAMAPPEPLQDTSVGNVRRVSPTRREHRSSDQSGRDMTEQSIV